MQRRIAELIDLPALRRLMGSLYRATGIKHALIDNDGGVLSAAGWEPVCSDFSLAGSETCRNCRQSERMVLGDLREGRYVSYECPNGLIDYATPVVIDGEQVGRVFAGQMFHAPPDLDAFRRRAAERGFDEAAYLQAVARVPIVASQRVPDIMAFLVGLANMLGQQGLSRLRQLEAEAELRRLNAELAERIGRRTEELSEKNSQLSEKILAYEQAETALRQETQFSDDIINSLPGIFYMLDHGAGIKRWNRKLCEVSGYSDEELAQMPALGLFDAETVPLVQQRIGEAFERGESSVEAVLATKDGHRIAHYFTGRRTHIDGNAYLVGLGVDITARKVLERELKRQAHEDSLTGLATRRHFFELGEQELARSRRYNSPLSFLMLDIDRFKEINDRYGHGTGDLVLQHLAEACRRALRSVDITGRIGGDEFAIILPETDRDHALKLAQRLRQAIADLTIPIGSAASLRCTVSIGATTLTSGDESIDTLIRQADDALYRAKNVGRDQVSVF